MKTEQEIYDRYKEIGFNYRKDNEYPNEVIRYKQKRNIALQNAIHEAIQSTYIEIFQELEKKFQLRYLKSEYSLFDLDNELVIKAGDYAEIKYWIAQKVQQNRGIK